MARNARYAWIVDTVGTGPDLGDMLADDRGVTGPRNADPDLLRILQWPRPADDTSTVRRFRIYDDDDVFYYAGRIIGEYDGLEPLDDFGGPNCGCTEIRYQDWTSRSGPFAAI